MSKFNVKQSETNRAESYEGALIYNKSLEQDWVNNLFSSFLQDGFYEDSETREERYVALTKKMLEKYGPKFVAKAARFSRNELGMRSISQLTMALVNEIQYDGKRADFSAYFHRPDDISEIFAAVDSLGNKRSHALVRGAADYLSKCSEYQLTKYAMSGKRYNMFDLINITHAHSSAIDSYKAGSVSAPDTWEHNIMVAQSDEDREQAWKDLVEGNKMGYLALLRNLRNILNCDFADSDWIDKYLVPQITNKDKIKKSLVFPYQIYVAYKNVPMIPLSIMAALDKAFRIAIGNVPNLDKSMAIVLDVSGSMETPISSNSSMKIIEVGAVYAAMLYLANPRTDFVKFGNSAKYCDYRRNVNVFDLIKAMQENDGCGYGTDILSVWNNLHKSYDRIFLVSDMQVMEHKWFNYSNPIEAMHKYFNVFGTAHIYSFDLGNYPTAIENPNSENLTMLTVLNDYIFKMLEYLENNGESLIDYINENY